MNKMVRFFIILFGFFLFILLFFPPFSIVQAQECSLDRECGVTHQGGNYCCGNNVCNNEIRPFCSDGQCFIDSSLIIDHIDPCPYGCSNDACNPPPPPAQVCTPNSQGAVCDTAYCPNGDVCGQGHKYCLWDGSGYGDCSEEVNNCATQCPGPVVTPPPGSPPPPPPPPPPATTPTCSLNVNPTSFTTGDSARYTVTSSFVPSGNSLYWGGKNNGTAIPETSPVPGFQANTSWSVNYGATAGTYERYGNIKWSGGNCQTNTVPITVCSIPTPPSSISVSCSNPGTSATISWPAVSGAAGYALRIDKDPNSWTGKSGDVTEDNLNTNTYTFNMTKQAAASNYRVWVHTKNSCGGLSPAIAEKTFSCVPNCQITSNNPSSATVNTTQTFTVVATSSTGNSQAGFQVYNSNGAISQDYAPDPASPNSSTTSKTSTFSWTPTATGTYTVICRAWNDSIAECKGGNKKDPAAAAQYDCNGPNASKTINVVTPTIYSILGTMYADGNPYTSTQGFSVNSTEGGAASSPNTSGSYSVTDLPFPSSNNSYYQFTFGVPDGYRVTSSVLSGWSCGGSWGQGISCPGPFLYGSVPQTTLQSTPYLTGINIFLQSIPAPTIISSLSCISGSHNGNEIFFSWANPTLNIQAIYMDISTDSGFATYHHKDITGTITTNGTGFGGFQGVSGALTYTPDTTYYVRLWNGYNHSQSISFTTPSFCPLTANCTVNSSSVPISINTGDPVEWKVNAIGGNNSYEYLWAWTWPPSPLLPATSAVNPVTRTYYNAGEDTGSATVTSAGQTVTSSCPQVTVTDAIRPWIQVTGDVHSNTRIRAPGGP